MTKAKDRVLPAKGWWNWFVPTTRMTLEASSPIRSSSRGPGRSPPWCHPGRRRTGRPACLPQSLTYRTVRKWENRQQPLHTRGLWQPVKAAHLGFIRPVAVFCYWIVTPLTPESPTQPIGDWKYFLIVSLLNIYIAVFVSIKLLIPTHTVLGVVRSSGWVKAYGRTS